MKYFFVFFLYIFCSLSTHAYWQQHTATTISVVLDDKNHFLNGFEKIVYTNHSPDTLRVLYVHLWPNAYKNDRTQFCEQQVQNGKTDFYYSAEKDKGYIDSLNFEINGTPVDFYYFQDNLDIATIELAHPILPNESITIETPFRVKIPKLFSRLGHNKQAYFISQWFPKVAVYDAQGWHPLPYLDQGEFYSEIGSYDVSITLPKNYIVMATGNCQTESEHQWMNNLNTLALPSDTMYRKSFPPSETTQKTIRFTEDNVHDFAWFADKRWILRIDTVPNLPQGNTLLYSAFLPEHQAEWAQSNQILKATIATYGENVGTYPYQTMKAVEGDMSAGGGMEYPTVCIIEKTVVSELKKVLIHEGGHNWFYGILASNEREHPWMDEGLNSFYEQKTNQSIDASVQNPKNQLEDFFYYQLAATNQDQSADLNATLFKEMNYGADVYFKSALLLQWLEAYMGKEDFKKGMQAYYNTWKFKHPQPQDFRKAMQDNSVKNLDWFFSAALQTERKIDFKIQKVKNQQGLTAIIKNKSDFKAPVEIRVFQKDSLMRTIWTDPFIGKTKIKLGENMAWTKVKLSAAFADTKLANDEYRYTRPFHKGGLKIGAGFGLNRHPQTTLFISPSIGYNVYDGFAGGLLLHNLSFPENRFQFAIAPQYSIGSKTVNGVAAFSYSWYPKHYFSEIRFQTNVKSYSQAKSVLNIDEPIFARYIKVAPFVEFVFKERTPLSTVSRRIWMKAYNINEEYFVYTRNTAVDSLYRPSKQSTLNQYLSFRYQHNNVRTFHPFAYNAELQLGQSFMKLGLEAQLKINYDVKNKALYLRGYAGKFVSTNSSADNSRYWLNTSFSGVNDYLFDGSYFGRNENQSLNAQQVSMQEGGFKLPTNLYANPLGRSDDWLMALNLKTDLPFGKLPLRLYVDVGTFADAKQINPNGNAVSFISGLELHLFDEMFTLYAPLVMSKGYSNYLKEMYPEKKLLNSISFSLNIQNMNWLRYHEKIFKMLTQ